MVQVRKLVLAIAAASALSSGMAHALGLGELTLKSTQNQPLLAEIELLDVKDLTAAQVVPSLAPEQEFSKAGVPRPAFLDDLRFTPVINADGKSVLRVTSSQPLSEPFVKFLVQVMWPNGRLMRDYSVLLDPAKFSPQTAAAASASASAPESAQATQYTTSSRDTLWEIAAKARNGGSVQQTMLAIQALNPDAFINGNINRLKTGQVLRLPDSGQSVQLPQAKAVNEVASQNADWRNGRRTVPLAQQLDATGRKAATVPAAKAVTRDGLSLVSGQASKAAGKGAAGDTSNVSDKLAMTQEGLDTSRRENAELQSRMKDLQSQLDKLQRLIVLKNDQLAKLEAEKALPVDPAAAIQAQIVAQAADAPEADIAPALEGVPATAVAPSPVENTAPPSTERKIQDLLGSPMLLGLLGGGAVLLLLLLLLLARRRKALQAAEKHARMARELEVESDFSVDLDMPQSSFEGLETPSRSVKLEPTPTPTPTPVLVPEAEIVAPVVASVSLAKPAGDALEQAQQLIEQRQFSEAAALLKASIDQAPQRSDLRLKLMQVYGELGEREAFVAQERQLVANGKNHAEVEQLKKRYPGMLVAAAAGIATAAVATQLQAQFVQEMMRDDREVESEPVAVPPIEEFDHDFDLSLDELEAASPAVVTPELPGIDKPAADSFEAVLEQQAEAQAAREEISDIDLGLPADFDLSLADESAPASAVPDSFSLELDKVNAELHRLSQNLEQSSMAEPFVDDEPEFDFLSGADETATKLDLAQAYIDMGDDEGARDILTEVMEEGNAQQQAEALEMLARLT